MVKYVQEESRPYILKSNDLFQRFRYRTFAKIFNLNLSNKSDSDQTEPFESPTEFINEIFNRVFRLGLRYRFHFVISDMEFLPIFFKKISLYRIIAN